MARKFNTVVIPSPTVLGDMSGSFTSNFTDLSNTEAYSVFCIWTGSPVGSLKLQASVDGVNFVDLPDSVTPVNGAGDALWDGYQGAGFDKVRLVYTASSGSGTLTMTISGKGLPD